MRFVSTRGAAGVPFKSALFEGLAPDGGLYVPERIDRWLEGKALVDLPTWSLAKIGARVLAPYVGGDLDDKTLASIVASALNFEIPLIEIEPGVFALELFHGPTLAFKDVGARVMARLMAALHEGGAPLTVLAATSGDTGGAVAHAFHDVPHTRVVILYPDGRVSPTQEAQLTMFNSEATNVRAYAVSGSFDDCQRLTKEAFADADLRRQVRLTSANSINVGRLLPQMIYYGHAVAQLGRARGGQVTGSAVFSTPSGNYGNLTAGLMQKRAGLPVARFVAATNVNDIVPLYLDTGRFEPRPSVPTLANAMDVGNPSNFDRMLWLYDGDVEAMRRDVIGSAHGDDEVEATIRRVYQERGYVLDPHSAIAYLGIKGQLGQVGQGGQVGLAGIFLATAHPAKFGEIVAPILGRAVPNPPALLDALSRERRIVHVDATLDAVRAVVRG
jgi:threonine synthase